MLFPHRNCSPGFYKRRSFTSSKGKRIKSTCVTLKKKKKCAPGEIMRLPYVRKFGNTVRMKGYMRKTKTGKVIHIIPKQVKTIRVGATCIKDLGKKGKGTQKIGPLRKGELAKYGYSTRISRDQRRAALRRAIAKLGSNNVFHKLDAVAKLSVRTDPKRSRTFVADRDWIRKQYGIKIF